MKFVQGNGAAVFTALVFMVVVLISFYVMMKPFAMVMGALTTDSSVAQFTNQVDCEGNHGHWFNGNCNYVVERPYNLVVRVRAMWLLAPIIFIIGLFIWLISVALRKDQYAYLR